MKVRKGRPRQKARRAERMTGVFDFRLYVAGTTERSIAAFTNLTKICQERLEDKCHITVIDILRNPRLAKSGQIVAIPTLVKTFPPPMRRVIGDLSITERVLSGLHIG
jgi:circadian clock protein KaiB